MSAARFIVGDTRAVTASLPDASVDLVLTSPPFLALRSYLPADHPDKYREIGQEPTPADFLQTLLELAAEWRRVLAPHGSICVELGDTYAGSGGGGGDYLPGGLREGQQQFAGSAASMRESNAAHWRQKNEWKKRATKDNGYPDRDDTPRPPRNGRRNRPADEAAGILAPRSRPGPEGRDEVAGWPMDKSLCGIPHLFHLSLAYGMNLLTGEPSPAGRWRVRNVVAWCRPNPPVGQLGDKFRPATSYMTVATVARDRYFDLDAVREAVKEHTAKYDGGARPDYGERGGQGTVKEMKQGAKSNPGGAPPLDWWNISTHPYPGSHYATWPPELCTRPIKAMCPERVCRVCGEPSRRIVEKPEEYAAIREAVGDFNTHKTGENDRGTGNNGGSRAAQMGAMTAADYVTVGWTDCGHDDWRNGIVFDPFAGSGTTLMVATGHGRDAIGIDLDERNADLARARVGMFLDVERHTQEVVA